MKTHLRLLMMLVTMRLVAAQTASEPSKNMTPESLHEQAITADGGSFSFPIVAEAFSSERIDLVRAAFREPRLSYAFTSYLRNMKGSKFKDQVMLMLLNESWNWDNVYDSEYSSPRSLLPLACFEVIVNRLKMLNLKTDDYASLHLFSSLESRKKIATLFGPFVEEQEKTDNEDLKQAPKDAGKSSPPSTTAENASQPQRAPSAMPQSVTKKAPEVMPTQPNNMPAAFTPWSFIISLTVAGLILLWLLLNRRS